MTELFVIETEQMLTDKRHAPPEMRQNKHEGTRKEEVPEKAEA